MVILLDSKYKPPGPIFIDRDLIKSKAYLSLTGIAPQVLLVFMSKRKMARIKSNGNKRKDTWVISNNGLITFPYLEAQHAYNISQQRFTRAIDQLIEHGFIQVSKDSSGLFGTPSLYSIIDTWRFFCTAKFNCMPREKRMNQVGFCR